PSTMIADRNGDAQNRPTTADGTRDWHYGSFHCGAPIGLCTLAIWCPCIFYGKIRQRLHHLKSHNVPLPRNTTKTVSLLLSSTNRQNIRDRHGIRGSTFGDLCVSYCCPCTLVQEHWELEPEENRLR
ncbi:PLAC8 family-domain-containing protein, partial [Russula brevipes]